MTVPNPMSREELLENAVLDAFGLLDEYESSLYTRSFHHAPAAVQNEIIQLQADLVTDSTFMPEIQDDPTPELRAKVLGAVNEAIEQETAELAPLASIGRPRGAANDVAGRLNFTSGLRWRAAALALCAGLLVVLYFATDVLSKYNQLAVLALQDNTDAQLEQMIGPTFKEYYFDPTATTIRFKQVNPATKSKAALIVLENSDKAFLVIEGLPWTTGGYKLSVRKADGTSEPVQIFESHGRLSGVHIALNALGSELKNVTWEISDTTGVLLASI